MPHRCRNFSQSPPSVGSKTQTGSLGAPSVGGGSRALCCISPPRPSCKHREAALVGRSSDPTSSEVMALEDKEDNFPAPSTATPAACNFPTSRSLNADPTRRTPLNRSAAVCGGGGTSAWSSSSAASGAASVRAGIAASAAKDAASNAFSPSLWPCTPGGNEPGNPGGGSEKRTPPWLPPCPPGGTEAPGEL